MTTLLRHRIGLSPPDRFMARPLAYVKLACGAFGWLQALDTYAHHLTRWRHDDCIAPVGATVDRERADLTPDELFSADSRITLTRRVYVVV